MGLKQNKGDRERLNSLNVKVLTLASDTHHDILMQSIKCQKTDLKQFLIKLP